MYLTLEELIRDLDTYFASGNENNSMYCLQEALQNYKGHDGKKYINFDTNNYKRNYVVQTNSYELIIICWKPNQKSKIHNHANNGCVLKVLEGEMTEHLYSLTNNKPVLNEINNYYRNDISYLNNKIGLHSICNNSNNNLISLHLYSPPNHKATIYEL